MSNRWRVRPKTARQHLLSHALDDDAGAVKSDRDRPAARTVEKNFESNSVRHAVGGGRRHAGGWRGRWRLDDFLVVPARALRVAAFLVARMISEPEPRRVRGLDCGVVPQRPLARRREAKLRGQLPKTGRDTRELVGDRVRPAQVVDRLGFNGMQVNESHEKCAVRVQKRPEMWLIEPGCVFLDPPHDSPDALVALPDFTTRGSQAENETPEARSHKPLRAFLRSRLLYRCSTSKSISRRFLWCRVYLCGALNACHPNRARDIKRVGIRNDDTPALGLVDRIKKIVVADLHWYIVTTAVSAEKPAARRHSVGWTFDAAACPFVTRISGEADLFVQHGSGRGFGPSLAAPCKSSTPPLQVEILSVSFFPPKNFGCLQEPRSLETIST